MVTAPPQSRTALLLEYLGDLERESAGYEYRGVRGWATADVVAKATRQPRTAVGEALDAAFARGLVIREDVTLPVAGPRRVWLYRVTDETARVAPTEPAPDRSRFVADAIPVGMVLDVWVPRGVAVVLVALREAEENSARRQRIPGEPGWRTGMDLVQWARERMDRDGEIHAFQADDLAYAARHGLARSRLIDPPPGAPPTRRVRIYRLSALGATVRPLVWTAPSDEAWRP